MYFYAFFSAFLTLEAKGAFGFFFSFSYLIFSYSFKTGFLTWVLLLVVKKGLSTSCRGHVISVDVFHLQKPNLIIISLFPLLYGADTLERTI